MKLIFGKSKWEMWNDRLDVFLQRVKADGFEATEIYLGSLGEPPSEIAATHESYGLALVGQILTQGGSYQEHLRSLEQQFAFAVECGPALINSHTGRDIFSFEENLTLFRRAVELSRQAGIPYLVETHRGRPTYSAIETRKYLEALPDLRITADFSHWMVVHESGLHDQGQNLELAIARSRYIHARVGYAEGPQVPDPRAPEWQGAVDDHVRLWQRIIDAREAAGDEHLFITPEFGPPSYMHTLPFTNQPVADAWEINVYMRDFLREALRTS